MTKAKHERMQRRENIAQSINILWSSIASHLPETVTTKDGNPEWHANCNRGYALILYTLCVEQHELAKQDYEVKYDFFGKPL